MRSRRRFGSRANGELAQNRRHVIIAGPLRPHEAVRDLRIRQSFREESSRKKELA
jgi:hypothetical protein